MPYYSGGGLNYAAQSASNSQQTIQNALNSLSQSLRFQQQLEEQRRTREVQQKAQEQARKDANLRFGIGLGTSIATDFIAPAAIGAFAGGQENVVSPEVGELPEDQSGGFTEKSPLAPRVLANTPMSLTGGAPGSGAPILAGSRPDLGIGTTKYAYGNTLGQSVGRGALAGLASRLAPGVMATSTALNPNLVYNRAVQGLELGQKYAALGLQAKNIEYDHVDRQATQAAYIERTKAMENRGVGNVRGEFAGLLNLRNSPDTKPEDAALIDRYLNNRAGANKGSFSIGDASRLLGIYSDPVRAKSLGATKDTISNLQSYIQGAIPTPATQAPGAQAIPDATGMPIGAKTRTVGGKLYYQDPQDGKWYPAR